MSEIQSLSRGLKILDLLSHTQDGLSITELAAELKVDKGSASRLVATLAKYGYTDKDPVSRRYRLGAKVVSLSRHKLSQLNWRDTAHRYMLQLMEQTGECAHLGIYAQGKVLYIDQVESPATLRVNAQIGQMSPLHCTALGKILLTYGHFNIPDPLEKRTGQTITSISILQEHLEQIRKLGYAVDDEEFDIGVRCIAVPVFDTDGNLAGSIGISGPATRMITTRLPELADIVVCIGKELSRELSFIQ